MSTEAKQPPQLDSRDRGFPPLMWQIRPVSVDDDQLWQWRCEWEDQTAKKFMLLTGVVMTREAARRAVAAVRYSKVME